MLIITILTIYIIGAVVAYGLALGTTAYFFILLLVIGGIALCVHHTVGVYFHNQSVRQKRRNKL